MRRFKRQRWPAVSLLGLLLSVCVLSVLASCGAEHQDVGRHAGDGWAGGGCLAGGAGEAQPAHDGARAEARARRQPRRADATKQRAGFQAARRGVVHYEFDRLDLGDLAAIPPLGAGRPKKGAPEHPARAIAARLAPPGERPVDSSWVYDLLVRIHELGFENYDPTVDGRAAARPKRRKLGAADDKMLFATRKKGSLLDRAQVVSESRAIEGKQPVSESAIRRYEKDVIGDRHRRSFL